jgi:hypothetical protein
MKFGSSQIPAYWKFKNQNLSNQKLKQDIVFLLEAFLKDEQKSFSSYKLLKFRLKKLSLEHDSFQIYMQKREMKRQQRDYLTKGADRNDLFTQMVESQRTDASCLYSDVQVSKIKSVRNAMSIHSVLSEYTEVERTREIQSFYQSSMKCE